MRQLYKVTFYNLDTNTFESTLIGAVSESNARAWADMMLMKNQQIESVELCR